MPDRSAATVPGGRPAASLYAETRSALAAAALPAGSLAYSVKTAAWLAASYVTVPFTVTAGGLVNVKFAPTIVRGSIGPSKVAVTFVFEQVPFALSRGFLAMTRGGAPTPPSTPPSGPPC